MDDADHGYSEETPDDELAEPTDEEYSAGVERLLAEVADAMASEHWVIRSDPDDPVATHRLFDGASLRHCCRLLSEIEHAVQAEQEFAVRLLGRAHLEAWFYGMYIHFGGPAAIARIAEDTLADMEVTDRDLKQFDARLAAEKKEARRRLRKVREANEGIARSNADRPDEPQKLLHDEPYVPKLGPGTVDLSERIRKRAGGTPAERLPLRTLVDALTEMAPQMQFGRESLRPVYHIYRFLSAAAPHPTIDLYDDYLVYDEDFEPGDIVPISDAPTTSLVKPTRFFSLYTTAFLAEYVLSAAGSPTPVATALRVRLTPTSAGGPPWRTRSATEASTDLA